jgi:plasmid replication initiation protein
MYDRVEEALKREDRLHQKTSMRRVIINELHATRLSKHQWQRSTLQRAKKQSQDSLTKGIWLEEIAARLGVGINAVESTVFIGCGDGTALLAKWEIPDLPERP